MMKRFALFGIVLLLFVPGAAIAAQKGPPTLSRVVRALERPFGPKASGPAAITAFQADFTQVSRISSLDRIQKGKGKVTVRLDHSARKTAPLPRFRWNYEQPTPQEIISDGHTLWVFQPENHQVIESKIDLSARKQPNDPLLFLTELGHLSTAFHLSWAEPKRNEQGDFLLQLVPKHPSPLLKRLVIAVRKEALENSAVKGKAVFPIAATTVFDSEGNSTLIRFHEVKTNLSLPEDYFHFTVPKGVEVLHSMPQFTPKSAE